MIIYLNKKESEGDIYIKLKYKTPHLDELCYDALIIINRKSGNITESSDELSEEDYNALINKFLFQPCSQAYFVQMQNIVIANVTNDVKRTVEVLKSEYLKFWIDMYRARNEAHKRVLEKGQLSSVKYYELLEIERNNYGYYEHAKKVNELSSHLKKLNCLTINDIFDEARQEATMLYLTQKL